MFKFFATIILLLLLNSALGQSLESVERDLLMQLSKIDYWRSYQGDDFKFDRYDSLQKANDVLRDKLIMYTASVPSSLGFPFSRIVEKGITVATSPDGLFRIYSWDTYTGGTMHYYENVGQFKIRGKVYSSVIKDKPQNGDPGYWYSSIYFTSKGNEQVYLVRRHGTYSTKDLYQGFKAFKIVGGTIQPARIIKTQNGLQSEIGVDYDFFSVYKRRERPIILVKYDFETKSITIPVVLDDGTVTGNSIIYKFNGNLFEKSK